MLPKAANDQRAPPAGGFVIATGLATGTSAGMSLPDVNIAQGVAASPAWQRCRVALESTAIARWGERRGWRGVRSGFDRVRLIEFDAISSTPAPTAIPARRIEWTEGCSPREQRRADSTLRAARSSTPAPAAAEIQRCLPSPLPPGGLSPHRRTLVATASRDICFRRLGVWSGNQVFPRRSNFAGPWARHSISQRRCPCCCGVDGACVLAADTKAREARPIEAGNSLPLPSPSWLVERHPPTALQPRRAGRVVQVGEVRWARR